jgi:acetoacetyl-CoA reductase
MRRIININTVVGQAGGFGPASHSVSGGGVVAFTKSVALETARYNITANAIVPGYTSTDIEQEIPEYNMSRIKARIPLGRFATPKEVAKAAAFLATEADYITGQELNVNGGCHM